MANKDTYVHQDVFAPKRRKKKFFLGLGIFLFAGGFLIGLVYLVFNVQFLKVRNFEITGTDAVAPAVIKNTLNAKLAAENRYWAMLGSDNILFWFLNKKPATLAEIPQVGSLEIQTDLFKRQVSISVEERKLFGILCENGGDCYGFDKDGVVFMRVPQAQGSLILRIDDENSRSISLGMKILNNDDWLKNIFDTLAVLNANDFHLASIGLRPLNLEEWRANLAAGPVFYFNLNFMPQDFAGVLKSMSQRLNLAKLTYLDFRVQNRIYYK